MTAPSAPNDVVRSLVQKSTEMITYRRREKARITVIDSPNDVVRSLHHNSTEMKTYRRREKAIITATDSPNDVVRSRHNSTELKTYRRRGKARISVTDSPYDVVRASLPDHRSKELKTYRRRSRGMAVTVVFNDVVLASLKFHISSSSSENLVIHRDDDADEKIKGFADSGNECQVTETMVLPGDDDDDGRGIADSLKKSKAKMPVGPVDYDNTESHQQAAQYPHANKLKSMQEIYAKTNPICQHFQPGQMSENRAEPKERTDVVDSDHEEGVTSRCPRKNQINSRRHSTRNRKGKALIDTTDSDVTTPLQDCGKLQGPVESGNSSAEEDIKLLGECFIEDHINAYPLRTRSRRSRRMVNRSGSEVTIPKKRVRRQPRRPMNLSTSIMSEGVLNSRQFYRYMNHLWSEVSAEKRNSIACMDCLWFNTYAESKWKEKVLQWIEREDIFSKKYVLVPIVLWSHWNLLIFCHFGESLQSESNTPCMLLLDSLHMADPKRLEPLIRKFVMDIYKNEKRPETKELIRKIPLLVPSVPQQIDDKKCGYFVLYYIYLFIKNAPEKFSIDEGYPYFMTEDWFTLEELDGFCRTLESVRVDTTSSDE